MSVNLPPVADLLSVPGAHLACGAAAIKAEGRDDVAVLYFDDDACVTGVFTQSGFRAPPVALAEERMAAGRVRALLINSGNANAATGDDGRAAAATLCAAAARRLGLEEDQVAPFSTGVIGEPLPVPRMLPVVVACADAARQREPSPADWASAARAIMTTDTAPKAVSRRVELDGVTITITGMAKGAGMIKPDMATMLAYLCCDARVAQPCLDGLVREVADASFNRVTIDADTSTNDAFVLVATGVNGPQIDADGTDAYATLRDALTGVAVELAQRIVRDGEGATKFVTVIVRGGMSEEECQRVAYTVAESPLVKTALFAGDPNWGRFCMAIGRAGLADLDQSRVDVHLDDLCVVRGGRQDPDYTEAAGAAVMARDELTITIELGRGDKSTHVWTTDLSYDYVRINAEYRT